MVALRAYESITRRSPLLTRHENGSKLKLLARSSAGGLSARIAGLRNSIAQDSEVASARGRERVMSSRTYRSTLVGVTALLGVAAGIPAATVEAKPQRPKLVTVSMTAVVEFVDDSLGVLCSDVAPGDVITATYTFDPLTPDTNPLDVVGDYFQQASGAGFRVDLGDAVTETDPGNIVFLVEVVNDYPGDYYVVRSYNNLPLSCGSTVSHIGWQLDDPTGTAFRSTDLSRKAPDLEDFVSFFGLDIEGQDYETGAYFRIRAHVVSAK